MMGATSTTFAAVSTFNRAGLDLYGRRMIWSFEEHWPTAVDLTIYSEGWTEDVERARVLDLEASSPWLGWFKRRHGARPTVNYRMDAVRFSHKVAALCHAAGDTDADVLIWIDGDVITRAPVALADLEGMAPRGDEWIAWLDRAKMYPECGFYMLNCRHRLHRGMMGMLQAMYANDKLFELPEWHDSYVLQWVVERAGIGTRSLSGKGHDTTHPVQNGPLSRWFEHMKGNRKRRRA